MQPTDLFLNCQPFATLNSPIVVFSISPGFGGLEQAVGPQSGALSVGDTRNHQASRQLSPFRNAKSSWRLRRPKTSFSRFQEPFYGGALGLCSILEWNSNLGTFLAARNSPEEVL